MSKYIDAEKLIAEIKQLVKTNKELKPNRFTQGIAAGYGDVLSVITFLQQEPITLEEDWVGKRKQECWCRRLSANGNYQCEKYEGVLGSCDGQCSWIVDYPKLKGIKKKKLSEVDLDALVNEAFDKYGSVDGYGQLAASFNRAELYSFIKEIARKEE